MKGFLNPASAAIAIWWACTCVVVVSVSALTPRERKLAMHAASELEDGIRLRDQAQKERDQAKAEAGHADQAAADSAQSAALANDKAVTAEAKAKAEHAELVRSATENAKMRPIVAQVNKWCGLGAILYGIGRLVHCLIWMVVGVVALVVLFFVASLLFPALRPILGVVTSTLAAIWTRLLALFKRKPPPPPPPSPPPSTA